MLTRQEIKQQIRNRISEQMSSFLTDNDLNGFIEIARKDLVSKLPLDYIENFITNMIFPVIANVREYSLIFLKERMVRFLGVEYNKGTNIDRKWRPILKLEPAFKNILDNLYLRPFGNDIYYELDGNMRIIFYPTPTVSNVEGFRIKYVAIPSKLTSDSDTMGFFCDVDNLIILKGCALALEKEREYEMASFYHQQYIQELSFILNLKLAIEEIKRK